MNHGLRIKRLVSVLLVLCFTQITWANRVVLGAEQTEAYLPLLEGKRVALLSNHTGLIIQAKGDFSGCFYFLLIIWLSH